MFLPVILTTVRLNVLIRCRYVLFSMDRFLYLNSTLCCPYFTLTSSISRVCDIPLNWYIGVMLLSSMSNAPIINQRKFFLHLEAVTPWFFSESVYHHHKTLYIEDSDREGIYDIGHEISCHFFSFFCWSVQYFSLDYAESSLDDESHKFAAARTVHSMHAFVIQDELMFAIFDFSVSTLQLSARWCRLS
jgi:hypothetical protein